ncbi:histidine phosphatase family protein [Bacillus sp. CGMCC 1.16607]|uniref:histidine phosphatase family protein n=1 Tax=Bacillus sp. CGMCC 1.16607 TaxID=3351842 RepID=UPI00363A80DD
MINLYITRHGETVWNTQKRMQGWSDSDLTENGIRNALSLGERLKDIDFTAIYSSPSDRTKKTADLIKGERDISILLDKDLREIHMGEWEGQTVSFIEKNFPNEHYSFWNTPHLYKTETGESFDELRNRVNNFLNRLQEMYTSGNILIVTHAVVIKTILAIFKDYPTEKLWTPPFIHDTSLTNVELIGEKKNFIIEGDLSHRVK